MKYIWRIRRIFLSKDLKRLIDNYSDTEEYLSPEVFSKVSHETLESAQTKNLILLRTKKTSYGNIRVIKLTDKGLHLANSGYIPNWEKIAAIVGIATLVFTLVAFGYQLYLQNALRSTTFTFVSTKSPDNIHEIKTADCWEGNTNRSDEFKCIDGNNIHTPCFLNYTDDTLIECPSDPYRSDKSMYFKLNDTRAKPRSANERIDQTPWFIKLDDGTECSYLSGATTVLANKRLDFGCNNKKTTLYLPIEKVNDSFYIGCLRNNRVEKCLVEEVWY